MKIKSDTEIIEILNQNIQMQDIESFKTKSKFIKIGSQEAEIALRVGKILIVCIMERSILEKVFMSELLINFLIIPRSDYLKGMRKLLIVMHKSEINYRVSEV